MTFDFESNEEAMEEFVPNRLKHMEGNCLHSLRNFMEMLAPSLRQPL